MDMNLLYYQPNKLYKYYPKILDFQLKDIDEFDFHNNLQEYYNNYQMVYLFTLLPTFSREFLK